MESENFTSVNEALEFLKYKSTTSKKIILKRIINSIYDINQEENIIPNCDKEKYFFYADQFWNKIMINEKFNNEFQEIGFKAKKNMMKYKNTNQTFDKPMEKILPLEYYLIKLYTEDISFFTQILDFFKNLI